MPDSEAFQRFQKSMNIGYEQWHDGIGYDLDAFRQMTPEERDRIAAGLKSKGALDWRDMEVLKVHGSPASFDKLRDVLASGSIDERASALRELIDMGKMHGSVPDVQLAHVLDDIDGIAGMTTALSLARDHAGPLSNAALLRATRDRPDVAVNFAGMICFLAGVTHEEFDWKLRPLFLRMGAGESESTRASAFQELCRKVGVDPSTIPARGYGKGVTFSASRRRQP